MGYHSAEPLAPHRVLQPGALPMVLPAVARITGGRPPPSTLRLSLLLRPPTVSAGKRLITQRVPSLDKPQPSKQGRPDRLQLPVGRGHGPARRALDVDQRPADPPQPQRGGPITAAAAADRSAPPLPYKLRSSGIGWLVAAVALVGLTLAVFAQGLRGPAVAVTVIDDAIVRWLAGLAGPGLVGPLRGLVRIGSWWVLYTLMYGLVLVLLVLRRWRHLIVWLVAASLGSVIISLVAMAARRPRPFGVDLRAS
jgi:hypothetical protein